MATRSTIAMEFADGTVEQIYCHWDGYLSNNGRILQEHYKDPFKVQQLIDGGAVSSLRPEVGEKHAFSSFESTPKISTEDYDRLYGDMTTFYARDRGEDLVKNKFKDFADYKRKAQSEEYNYILRSDGRWYVEFYGEFDGLLDEAIERESAEEAA
jgi:hypothetical protein